MNIIKSIKHDFGCVDNYKCGHSTYGKNMEAYRSYLDPVIENSYQNLNYFDSISSTQPNLKSYCYIPRQLNYHK